MQFGFAIEEFCVQAPETNNIQYICGSNVFHLSFWTMITALLNRFIEESCAYSKPYLVIPLVLMYAFK